MPKQKLKPSTPPAYPIDQNDRMLTSAAKLIGCPVERFLAWKQREDGSLVVIDFDGHKYQFTAAELEG
jgi:hypothetical protein